MFKKIILPAILAAISASAIAKPTLTDANFSPVLGDAFAIRICNETLVNPGSSGAGITWNFASLTTKSVDTGQTISKFSGNGNGFYGSATLAIKGPAAVGHATNYISTSSTALRQYGYYIHGDTNLVLTNPEDQLRYPWTYLDSFDDTCTGVFKFGPSVSAPHTGYIHVECDGYGTLLLPFRTDNNVLRVHTTQNFTDNIYIFGIPVPKSYIINSYSWYKADYHTALFTIQTVTEVGMPTPDFDFVAYAVAKVTGVDELSKKLTGLQLYPNPATSEVNISFNAISNEKVSITMYDMLGREVAVIADKQVTGQQDIKFKTAGYPRGAYLIRLESNGDAITRKIVIE